MSEIPSFDVMLCGDFSSASATVTDSEVYLGRVSPCIENADTGQITKRHIHITYPHERKYYSL